LADYRHYPYSRHHSGQFCPHHSGRSCPHMSHSRKRSSPIMLPKKIVDMHNLRSLLSGMRRSRAKRHIARQGWNKDAKTFIPL